MNERTTLVLVAVVVTAAVGAVAGGTVVAGQPNYDGGPDAPQGNSSGHPNVEHGLLQGGGGPSAESSDDGGVTVVVEAEPGRAGAAADAVANRGTVEGRHGDLVRAEVSRDRLESLGEEPSVSFVRSPLRPERLEVTSEGVETIRADVAAERNATGEGATIALIDLGFDPSHAPIADNVVETKSFAESNSMDPSDSSAHGDATAEIVADVAPDANLVLVTVTDEFQLLDAMEWVNDHQEVDAVSMSLGFKGGVPNDGTSPFDQRIDQGVESGTAWFVSSGNEADGQHWHGEWRDQDGDDLVEFSDAGTEASECNGIQTGGYVSVTLQWNDWVDTDQRYALALTRYDQSSGQWETVDYSDNDQTGNAPPVERVFYQPQTSGTHEYCLFVLRENADGTADFDVFARDGLELEYSTTERSVTPPATTRKGVAVGAVHWDTEALEPYSSRGPTIDGRLKPEVVAPARVSTEAYAPYSFPGTSAAAPHAAGAAAAIHGANTSVTGADLQDRVAATAADPDGESYATYPNDLVGYGLVDAALAVPPQDPRNATADGPIDNESVEAVTVTVGFGAVPKPGEVTVRFEDEVGDSVAATAPTNTTDATTNVTVDATTLADGNLTVTASATGSAGWSNDAGFTAGTTVTKDAGGLTLADYADESGVVQNDGLRTAVEDWRTGDIDTALLRDVVDAWRTGEQVG